MSKDFEAIGDRLPPQNIEAEEAVLGGILIDPEAISRVLDTLNPEMFYVGSHQEIFRACLMLHNQSNPTDMMSLTTWLSDRDLLEKIGGQSKIAQLCDRTVSAVNIDFYAQLVADKYTRRKLAEAARAVVETSYSNELELAQLLDQSEQKIFAVTQSRAQQGLVPASDILTKTFYELESRFNSIGTGNTTATGLITGFYDFDAMTNGLQRSDLIVLAGRPSMGKCLAFDSELLLADGSIATIASIYQHYQKHQVKPELLTLGDDWRLQFTKPTAFIDDGIKPVFRIITALGRQIETTLTHPFLTITGWRSLGKLRVGDKIAVPRQVAVFGKAVCSASEVKLLAYLLGDGCLTETSPRFTNINPQIQNDFTVAVTQFSPNLKVTIDTHGDRAATLHITAKQRGAGNPLITWLRDLEIWGKNAHHKSIPTFIFSLEKSLIALFLNRLLATDGWMSVLSSGQVQAGYATVSEQLARQVQHLLLRFGIIAKLKFKNVKYKQEIRHCWQLDITDALSLKVLITEIGIFGKEEAISKANLALGSKRYQTNTDLIPMEVWQELAIAKGNYSWKKVAEIAGISSSNIHVGKRAPTRDRLGKLATAIDYLPLQNLATSDIYWDKITAIEFVGEKQVYDLTIPETHNFIANDICVHNTAFGLEIARKMAEIHRLPVAIFSLEMSKEQLVYRLLASQSKVRSSDMGIDSNRLRTGQISENEWGTVAMAIGGLSELPLYIDDTPNPPITELRSKARRLQSEKGGALGLILIDYLQLMEGSGSDNRVQEISRITRSLKALARELNVPVIALSQLSRGVEARTNKRPMLSDLRESGCLSGDSLITMADTGVEIPICELVGKSDFAIWAVNPQTWKQEKAMVSNAFCTGSKTVYRLETQLGRSIKATANHQFLTIQGWNRLDTLQIGDRIAMPRFSPSSELQTLGDAELALLGHLIGDGCTLPRHAIQYTTRELDLAELVVSLAKEVFREQIVPRITQERSWYQVYLSAAAHLTHGVQNPITKWLQNLGVFGLRSYEKFIPKLVFEQPREAIAIFLRHIWVTDGCILTNKKSGYPTVYYASSSEKLSRGVQSLLLRLEINATIRILSQGKKGRDQYHVVVSGKPDLEKFVNLIGTFGKYKQGELEAINFYLCNSGQANTNRDLIPKEVWKLYANPAREKIGLTSRQMQEHLGNKYCGTSLFKGAIGRDRAHRLAHIVKSQDLLNLSESNVYWDKVVSITALEEEMVYDLTVPNLENFVANNIYVHNSIEQDADLVINLYRDEYYNPETPDRGVAEIIIAKHRNGPVGTVKLLFEPRLTKFENMASGRN